MLLVTNLDVRNVTIEELSVRVQIYTFTLMFLYVVMDGLDWNLDESWYTRSEVCSWIGVDCVSIDVIHRLTLANVGLRGSIPSEIQFISTLQFLDFSDNTEITGTIPSELSLLSNFKSLDLSRTTLTGTIPWELLYHPQLDTLHLSSNRLSGSIPTQLFNNGNGTISSAFISPGASSLRSMDLSYNFLTGSIPSDIGLMTRLVWLRLEGNQLSHLPSEIGLLSSLEWLDLRGNRFTGTIPELFGRLARLEILNLYGSGFTGKIPESFCEDAAAAMANDNGTVMGGGDMARFRQIVVDCRFISDCSCCSRIPQDDHFNRVEVQCAEDYVGV